MPNAYLLPGAEHQFSLRLKNYLGAEATGRGLPCGCTGRRARRIA